MDAKENHVSGESYVFAVPNPEASGNIALVESNKEADKEQNHEAIIGSVSLDPKGNETD